ncbi:MAG TPA: methyltransferase domain-containing protein [Phycisphaerales bacterium]|nr:methyltransferase domain-containing protein [Phycisphaerales bacterium]
MLSRLLRKPAPAPAVPAATAAQPQPQPQPQPARPLAPRLTQAQERAIEQALRETYFRNWDRAYLDSPDGQRDIAAITKNRYYTCLDHIVPWIERVMPLKGKHVLEVGCGTGSSTSGIAHSAAHVHGYDIDAEGLEGAKARARALNQTNITFHLTSPTGLLTTITNNHLAGSLDVTLLYAVLEHQHVQERIDTLQTCWNLLRPGGLLVVVETPNRLTYFDGHTAMLPFYHMLPAELAIMYAPRSPRAAFPQSIAEAAAKSHDEALERLARWGRGVSYHEFELALGDLNPLVVAHGYEPEVHSLCQPTPDQSHLQAYWKEANINVPVAFTRADLTMILRKPA